MLRLRYPVREKEYLGTAAIEKLFYKRQQSIENGKVAITNLLRGIIFLVLVFATILPLFGFVFFLVNEEEQDFDVRTRHQ